jgi:hypothetical protein
MIRFLSSILVIFAGYFLFVGPSECFGLDEEGCLTCHQYPGLVRLEKENGVKELHIDEEKFFTSPHGEFRCKQCHTTIAQVPHTGETRTDCTTECHQKDAKNNNLVRSFLNMHTGFMFCEVCHINRGKVNHLVYDWEDTENADFSGEPFGTYFNPRSNKAHKADEHFISRIAVFSLDEGKKRGLMNSQDTAAANEFMLQQKNLKPDARKKELDYFHRDIERKEISGLVFK